jgi:hypothetical protein
MTKTINIVDAKGNQTQILLTDDASEDTIKSLIKFNYTDEGEPDLVTFMREDGTERPGAITTLRDLPDNNGPPFPKVLFKVKDTGTPPLDPQLYLHLQEQLALEKRSRAQERRLHFLNMYASKPGSHETSVITTLTSDTDHVHISLDLSLTRPHMDTSILWQQFQTIVLVHGGQNIHFRPFVELLATYFKLTIYEDESQAADKVENRKASGSVPKKQKKETRNKLPSHLYPDFALLLPNASASQSNVSTTTATTSSTTTTPTTTTTATQCQQKHKQNLFMKDKCTGLVMCLHLN